MIGGPGRCNLEVGSYGVRFPTLLVTCCFGKAFEDCLREQLLAFKTHILHNVVFDGGVLKKFVAVEIHVHDRSEEFARGISTAMGVIEQRRGGNIPAADGYAYTM